MKGRMPGGRIFHRGQLNVVWHRPVCTAAGRQQSRGRRYWFLTA